MPLQAEPPTESESGSEWVPFVIPAKLDLNSPLNIEKLVLDPPAGKHGFVTVKEGHFCFEDGMPARFWGTNLCISACFPTHQQAEMMAERIAFFGFNAVRLHQIDIAFEPQGIFKDTAPAFKDPQRKTTSTLSENQLERLDYLIFQLKMRGIYVDINLLVSRRFTVADGVRYADQLGMAAKPVSMFDGKLIELQKQYAKNLLTHFNPYTKLRYCDDPAVALIEITNENSLERSGEQNIPAYYLESLNEKWELWRRNNKGTKKDFYAYLEKEYFKTLTHYLRDELGIKAPITGSQYSLATSQEACDFIDTHAYWDHPHFPKKPWDSSDFRIHNKSMLADKNLGLIGEISKFSPENTGSVKPFTVTEWNHCYPNQYSYETPVLLAATAAQQKWDALFQFDFKAFLREQPGIDSITNYFEIMSNPQQLTLNAISSLLFLKADHLKNPIEDNVLMINSDMLEGATGSIKNKTLSFETLTLTSKENGALFIYSPELKPLKEAKRLVLIVASEIRNTNSYWDRTGKFHWGSAPTVSRNFEAYVELHLPQQSRVFALKNTGERGNELTVNKSNDLQSFTISTDTAHSYEIIF